MSAEEPAYVIERFQCPRCDVGCALPVPQRTRDLFAFVDVECPCGWTGRVRAVRVIEETVALSA